jgi:Cu/Ag efflux pump CusA
VVPLVLSTGAGAEMRHAMGVAVFSGMLGVTFFGLILTPVFFVVIERVVERGREPEEPTPVEPAARGETVHA